MDYWARSQNYEQEISRKQAGSRSETKMFIKFSVCMLSPDERVSASCISYYFGH